MILIIVESPTKAKTFRRLIKDETIHIFATMGHFRDLPSNELAINYQKKFQPTYQILPGKEKIVEKLKDLHRDCKELVIATDPDREGESIGYHIAFVLGFVKENWPDFQLISNHKLKRIIFHEITKKALEDALKSPTILRTDLIKAQQARRLLDRIVGYEVSPLLWQKLKKNWLSAGRVQTVALRLVVEREKEIESFKKEKYCEIVGTFRSKQVKLKDFQLKGKLVRKGDEDFYKKENLKLFAQEYSFSKTTIDENKALRIEEELKNDKFFIAEINEFEEVKNPPPPFTTSLLQQESINYLSLTANQTMKIAQNLYEAGLITYHRTDSFNLSTRFIYQARDYIKKNIGEEFLSEKPRIYKTKSKLAQEAHEAIRPTTLNPKPNLKNLLHLKLYQLIFNRAIATQMSSAKFLNFSILINSEKGFAFQCLQKKIQFKGFLILNNSNENKRHSSEITNFFAKKGEYLKLEELEIIEKITSPPPRYNEASLIRVLEEKGIGRPSTYAPIITLIQERNYVEKHNQRLRPSPLGKAISDYLSKVFIEIFNLDFTAKLEEDLDKIAQGEKNIIEVLEQFFKPLKETVEKEKQNPNQVSLDYSNLEKCPKCSQGALLLKRSKFGKFWACSNFPKCNYTQKYQTIIEGVNCPKCHGKIVVRFSKNKKKFYGCEHFPKCNFISWSIYQLKKKQINKANGS